MKINDVYNQDVFDFLSEIEDSSIDLAIIDPPYNQKIDQWDSFPDEKSYFDFTFKWIDKMLPKMKETGSFYIFNNPYNAAIILNYLKDKNVCFRNWIVWHKKDGFNPSKKKYVSNQEVILFYTLGNTYTFNYDDIRIEYESKSRIKHAMTKGILKNGKRWYPNEKGKLCTDVWDFSSERHKTKLNGKIVKNFHPTPKPLDLIERIVKASSSKNDLVLDLFSGSGTTSVVSKINQRNYIGCEKDSQYWKLLNERLNKLDK